MDSTILALIYKTIAGFLGAYGLYIALGLWLLSEILAQIPSIKANSVFQLVYPIIHGLVMFIINKGGAAITSVMGPKSGPKV